MITDHWHRSGPVRPDGSDGYWICAYNGCGQHRGDHVQAEGEWMNPLYPLHQFVAKNHQPSHCKPCGRRRRHTLHMPLFWADLGTEVGYASRQVNQNQ